MPLLSSPKVCYFCSRNRLSSPRGCGSRQSRSRCGSRPSCLGGPVLTDGAIVEQGAGCGMAARAELPEERARHERLQVQGGSRAQMLHHCFQPASCGLVDEEDAAEGELEREWPSYPPRQCHPSISVSLVELAGRGTPGRVSAARALPRPPLPAPH